MMTIPQGPSSPFQLLFADDADEAPSLPESFRAIYPGDWRIRPPKDRPYIYSNFGMSRDGRISYNEPDLEEAYHVTLAASHDRWLMGLLRMRADAVLLGDTTFKLEKFHLEMAETVCPWTAEFIYPADAKAFAAQRKAEGRQPNPLLVILSLNGDLDLTQPFFTLPNRHFILATTNRGAKKLRTYSRSHRERVRTQAIPATVDVHDLGDAAADLNRLVQLLHSDYGIRHLLCEGGAGVFANMLQAGLIDEEFVTWCPTFVGRSQDHHRPSYTEGVAWRPGKAPYSIPLSLHRGGDYIFLHTQCQYPEQERLCQR